MSDAPLVPDAADDAAVRLFGLSSELARAYVAVDWSATALGPVAQWSGSLKNSIRMMLASRFAMWMCWGPDLTFFCNETYRADTLGAKFPWALGRPTHEVWAEVWDAAGPRIETAMQTGIATWDEGLLLFLERSGYREETYHTFSYSPLADDAGDVAGMLCVVSEDTGRVVSERRITALRDLGGALTGAQTEPDVHAAAQQQLAADPYDLPFVVAYLLDGRRAVRHWSAGIEAGHPAAPAEIDLADPDPVWPSVESRTAPVPLAGRFADLPTGAWPDPPLEAALLPLRQPGSDQGYGFLVVGLNRYRPVDDGYLGFFDLVAEQIAGALTRARAFEAERVRAERMLELDRAKTTFFTNVSHELRTPLTLLLGPAEDALADLSAAPAERARMEVIHRNGERLLKLVNTLLDFSRLESGQAHANVVEVDLARETRELAAMFDSAFSRVGLRLSVETDQLPGRYLVDREMWAKIVLNLLSNALKATFTGGVTVALTATGDRAQLRVTDTGVGIAPDEQARLFDRFHRVTGAALRTHEGSGIGLALVAELAAMHGGTVAVSSELGVGTTFTVEIPEGTAHLPADAVIATPTGLVAGVDALGAGYLAEALRWSAETPRADGDRPVRTAPDDRPVVLVADDNADMRDYVTALLSDTYRVVAAPDGEAALELARTVPPDLVLTDVMMPRLDGFGLLAALRADDTLLHVPVVMISARSGSEAAVEGLESGADDYLVKPFSSRELRARVRANLELDRVRRLLAELERQRGMLARAEALAHVGSYEYDIASERVTGSDEYHRLMDVSDEELARDGLAAALRAAHPDDRERGSAATRHTLATGEPLALELRLTRSGSDERVVWVSGVLERASDGAATRLIGSVQDITERRRGELAFAAAAAAQEGEAREHAIAAELQRSLLPAAGFDADHLEVATFYRAGVEGTEVGGDWYDVIELDAGRTALVLGDVMGRGVRAAAVMGQLRATVRAYARLDLPPDQVLHLLDAAVREISADTIVTCVYAIYDPSERVLVYANAGHLPPLLRSPDGTMQRLTAGGPPLGTGRAWARPEAVALQPGALVALYTDGLVETRTSDLDDGIEDLAALLAAADGPVGELPSRLVAGLRPEGPEDDIAVLLARVSPESEDEQQTQAVFERDPDAPRQARELATAHLRSWGVADERLFDVELIVSELVTNAIRHGGSPVTFRLRHAAHRLYIDVHDTAPTSPQMRHAGPADHGGRGLLIIATLAERWGTRRTEPGKSVWCILRLGA